MRLEYLQYFLEVCRTKSMSTAARDLHVAQQTVSMAIKSLEEELGVTLLERTNRGVRVTASGEYIAEEARQLLEHYTHITQFGQTKQPAEGPSDVHASLAVACAPLLTLSIMPVVLDEFSQLYPHIKICLDEEQPGECYTQLQNGKCDLAVYYFNPDFSPIPPADASYTEEFLGTDRLTALVNIQSPLAHKKYLTKKDLAQAPLVLYTSDTWQQTWILGTLFGEQIPENILYTTSLLHLFDTVRQGRRIAFNSRKIAQHTYPYDPNRMVNIPLRPRIDMKYYIGIQKSLLNHEYIHVFLKLFQKHFAF